MIGFSRARAVGLFLLAVGAGFGSNLDVMSQEVTRGAIRTVAVMGQPVEGLPGGVEYSGGSYGIYRSIGGGGHVVFDGGLTAPPESDVALWWQDAHGSTRLVAREGDPAPEMPPGTTFTEGLWYANLNLMGDVVFTGNYTGAMEGRGVFADSGGSLRLVAGTGQPAPGLPGRKFNTTEFGWISDAGHTMVLGWTVPNNGPPGTPGSWGAWTQLAGQDLKLLVAMGLDAPGTGGSKFSNVAYPVIDDDGRSIFFASVDASNGLSRGGIWAGRDYSDVHPLVQQSDPYAGLDQGFFSFISSYPQLDATGGAVFAANVYSAATGEVSGIWRADDSGVQEILRTDTVPPNVPGFDYQYWGVGNPQVSASGKITFPGRLQYGVGVGDQNNDGIWQRTPDGIVTLVVREGDSFPGAEPDERLWMWPDPSPVINARGQVAFMGIVTTVGQQFFGGSAIFAQDLHDQLHLIVHDGDVIDVDDGPGIDLRTIEGVGFTAPGSTSGDSFTDGINDRGEVFFEARFTDGTRGFFVSRLVAVPEPDALFALLLAGAIVMLSRRARFDLHPSR